SDPGSMPSENGGDPASDPAAGTTESAPPGDRDLDGYESCRILCDRNARCGAADAECLSKCHADVTNPACAAESTTFFECVATRESECGIPIVCTSAACAFNVCVGHAPAGTSCQ